MRVRTSTGTQEAKGTGCSFKSPQKPSSRSRSKRQGRQPSLLHDGGLDHDLLVAPGALVVCGPPDVAGGLVGLGLEASDEVLLACAVGLAGLELYEETGDLVLAPRLLLFGLFGLSVEGFELCVVPAVARAGLCNVVESVPDLVGGVGLGALAAVVMNVMVVVKVVGVVSTVVQVVVTVVGVVVAAVGAIVTATFVGFVPSAALISVLPLRRPPLVLTSSSRRRSSSSPPSVRFGVPTVSPEPRD